MKGKKHQIKDLVGQKFNKLTVVGFLGTNKKDMGIWECKCDCGNTTTALTYRLKNGGKKSCGCLNKRNDSNWTGYGEISGAFLCQLKHQAKKRGLKVSIDGKYLWELYLKQDKKCALSGMELIMIRDFRYKYRLQTASLDRIDNNKPYIKGNLQWVHKEVNFMKQNMTEDKLLYWCEKLLKHKENQDA